MPFKTPEEEREWVAAMVELEEVRGSIAGPHGAQGGVIAKARKKVELIELCRAWNPENPDTFPAIVARYLEIQDNPRDLPDWVGAAVSTPKRWASGISRPLPFIQAEVVKLIESWASKEPKL